MAYNPSAQAGTPQIFSAVDNITGLPLAGGQLYTYISGTTTLQATYTDNTLTTQCANPIILDNYGQAIFWLASENYRFNLLNSAGVQQAHYPMDNIQPTSVSNLASNLAAHTNNSQGAGLVGYNSALTYPANTVGAGIKAFSSSNGASLIGTSQSVSGAVTITQANKNSQMLTMKDFPCYADGVTDDSSNILIAVTNSNFLIFTAGTYAIKSNLIIPASCSIRMDPGAIFKVALGITLTINGNFAASQAQCFNISGTLVGRGLRTLELSWFGSTPDGNISTTPYTGNLVLKVFLHHVRNSVLG